VLLAVVDKRYGTLVVGRHRSPALRRHCRTRQASALH
jgi:hypothetical protein